MCNCHRLIKINDDALAIDLIHKFHNARSISHNAPFRTDMVHIFVLNGAFWYMERVHCGICEIGLLWNGWSQ